jgi:hypothetical protein
VKTKRLKTNINQYWVCLGARAATRRCVDWSDIAMFLIATKQTLVGQLGKASAFLLQKENSIREPHCKVE